MKRKQFHHDGLNLSYLDTGGDGKVLIALHGHWMEAVTYTSLAEVLAPAWRVIALDQRGHGDSDHAQSYTRDDYLGDLAALYGHLEIDSAVLLGNSLGGVNAYQFAARHSEQVQAMIVEDIGAIVDADVSFTLNWGGTFSTRDALSERIGERLLPYVVESFRETDDGWRLAFDPQELFESQRQLNGDHWTDWLASSCPALLIRGSQSRITTESHIEEMTARRSNTRLVTLEGGHVVHQDNPTGFVEAVRGFLQS